MRTRLRPAFGFHFNIYQYFPAMCMETLPGTSRTVLSCTRLSAVRTAAHLPGCFFAESNNEIG